MSTAETKIASYFAKYSAPIAKLGKALRAKMRARLPGLFEIVYVYENQNSLVIAYSPTEHGGGSDAICGIGIYPDSAKLFFTQGKALAKADAGKLLQGSGKLVRHVVLNAAADLDRAEIEALIAASLAIGKVRVKPGAKGGVVIKADEQKQRAAKRVKKAAKPAARRKAKPKN